MKTIQHCLVVINPVAGGGKSLTVLTKIKKVITDLNWNAHFFKTVFSDDLKDIALLAVNRKCTYLICIGGDGTVNGVINSIFNHNAFDLTLVVIPAGTGSDYARSLYLNSIPRNISEWGNFLEITPPSYVDIGQIIFGSSEHLPRVYFSNMLGIGISSKIVQSKNTWSKYLSALPFFPSTSLGYIAPTLYNLFNYNAQKVSIESDIRKIQLCVKAIFVAKGKYSGGGMKFGKDALLDDGLLDLLVCSDIGARELYKNISKLYSGNFEGLKFLQRFKIPWANFVFEKPVDIEYDGEVLKNTKEFRVEVSPFKLKILKKII